LIDKVKKSVADVFAALTADTFYENSDLANDVELAVVSHVKIQNY
jgi:hypothetical protein